jgi:hypothetical protein
MDDLMGEKPNIAPVASCSSTGLFWPVEEDVAKVTNREYSVVYFMDLVYY